MNIRIVLLPQHLLYIDKVGEIRKRTTLVCTTNTVRYELTAVFIDLSVYFDDVREERRVSASRSHHYAFGRGFACIFLFRAELIPHAGMWDTSDKAASQRGMHEPEV